MKENENSIVLKLVALHFLAATVIYVSWAIIDGEATLEDLAYIPGSLILFHLWTEVCGVGFPVLPLIYIGLIAFGLIQTTRKIKLRDQDHFYIRSILGYQLLVSLIYSSLLIALAFGRYFGP